MLPYPRKNTTMKSYLQTYDETEQRNIPQPLNDWSFYTKDQHINRGSHQEIKEYLKNRIFIHIVTHLSCPLQRACPRKPL